MWTAICSAPFFFKGKTYTPGEQLTLTDQQMRDLSNAGLIGAMKRIAAEVETETVEAPEDASRNYRRKGR